MGGHTFCGVGLVSILVSLLFKQGRSVEMGKKIVSDESNGLDVNKVGPALEAGFIFSEDMARILTLAIGGHKNCIIYGPAGHAKSEMVKAAIAALDLDDEVFIQFFGEGMDESRLFGGLDFGMLDREKRLEYFPERSFLNRKIAIFEELFDAPPSVLLALKDTLTAGEMRNGAQRFPMSTTCIIALTNRNPKEISELGAAAHALVERFPLQLELKWPSYEAKDYAAMFDKVVTEGPKMNGFSHVLADLLSRANNDGSFVSPRTAVHALEVCQASARLAGRKEVKAEDMHVLRYVPGLEGLAATLAEELAAAKIREQAVNSFTKFKEEYSSLYYATGQTAQDFLLVWKKLLTLDDKLGKFKCPDNLVPKRDELRNHISARAGEMQAAALNATEVS